MVAVECKNLAALNALVANIKGSPATLTAYLNKPNDKGETVWKIINSPTYHRPGVAYAPGYTQAIDDMKTLLINYGAVQ